MLDKKVMWIKMVVLLGGSLFAGLALAAETPVGSELPHATPSIPSQLTYPLPSEQVRAELAQQLRVSNLQIEPIIEMLQSLDWVGQLREDQDAPRWVLLVDPTSTAITPLLRHTILPQAFSLNALNHSIAGLDLHLSDLFAEQAASNTAFKDRF